MGTVFFTGFPGFLGSELLPGVLARSPEHRAVCLVQTKFAEIARMRAVEMERVHPHARGRISIVEGDITKPGLGMASAAVGSGVVEIYHLAAVYDLSVRRDFAMRVNVEGTRHLLDFACDCPAIERFHYVSTCYISGTHPGLFSEDDLDRGQRFHNYYEETKFLAEVEVQKSMRGGLPATIYRPAIVVGDSETGATQKYDGPYFVMRFLLRQSGLAVLPVVGDPAHADANVVPRDFVVQAISYLSGIENSRNRVYQLADPNPLTVDEMIRELSRATRRKVIRVPLPLPTAKFMLRRVPGVERLMGIPADALDYFAHPARYGTEHAQAALAGSGIRCPNFREYVDTLVRFVTAHPEIGAAAMA